MLCLTSSKEAHLNFLNLLGPKLYWRGKSEYFQLFGSIKCKQILKIWYQKETGYPTVVEVYTVNCAS